MHRHRELIAFLVGLFILPSFFILTPHTFAQSEVDKLKSQIQERQARLDQIEQEIKKYEGELNKVGAERKTLESAINQLELERKKVLADISYTENQIDSTDLQISQLGVEISKTKNSIEQNKSAVGEILRNMNSNDDEAMVELLLQHDNLSEFWDEIDSLEQIKNSVRNKVNELKEQTEILQNKKLTEAEKKEQLMTLQKKYSGQKAVLENNKAEKSQLLSKTKSKESNYQTLLAQKKAAKEQLEKEVQDIESQLQYILDPSTIPTAGDTVFQWPVHNFTITQYFGYTKFALSQKAYSGGKHNGVDFGVPVGSSVYAPLSGTVRATGNTDLVPGCYSWGKWVLIDHPNGLSTLFGHLSHIGVTPGQQVQTGEIIAYSGNTGYSTGPHLHFTVYAQDAVQVKKFNEFKSVTSCGPAHSPFAAVEGYLDPMDYLPSL